MACLMVENSSPCADSKQGESTSRKEKERERNNCVLEKGGCTPPYIGQGGCHPPPLPHVGLNSQRGECAGLGGDGPHPWRQAQGGKPPPLLMGPIGPYSLFPFLNYFNMFKYLIKIIK